MKERNVQIVKISYVKNVSMKKYVRIKRNNICKAIIIRRC